MSANATDAPIDPTSTDTDMLCADKKPVAFDVDIKDPANAAAPMKVVKRFEDVQAELEDRRNISKEEIAQRLEAAEARRQELAESKLRFAKEDVQKVKQISEAIDTLEELQAAEKAKFIEEKLEQAALRAEEQLRDRQKKLESQHREVEQRRTRQTSGSGSDEETQARLDAAEQRRKQLEEERLAKLRENERRAEEAARRRQEVGVALEDVQSKLDAAELRRKQIEEERAAKIKASLEHVDTVRRRRAESIGASGEQLNGTTGEGPEE
ncbi:hypothetical protein AMAG_02412 [Allomyces macrogynus ATCC 38327]|uniref:Uncharacterized protein n=1 Tax=Allomyces macrogynus (strain ATCC 38327) TaxID=578462 RepID=A0A0L0S244_ALLM3|nr:hypothetical protein AMAG_02412 [Allomyces macrogynus ATCC 38327]|eukprot:KNE56623.1 hypothetical protein AMAG_02412 [Allomyces macrogynus ATCC 38327]